MHEHDSRCPYLIIDLFNISHYTYETDNKAFGGDFSKGGLRIIEYNWSQ